MNRRKRQGGSTLVEFAMIGTPILFAWISLVQMALGMWDYHTLQYALKQGGLYVSTHGSATGYCLNYNCRVQDAAAVIAQYAIGMRRSDVNLTFTPVTSAVNHTTTGTAIACTLDVCLTKTDAFPSGAPEFEIKAEYQFKGAMGMVAFGSSPVQFGNAWLPAYTHQVVLF